MGSTKKVLSAGRYGSRYGIGIRKRILKVEAGQLKKHACPNCGYDKVKRLQRGIFFCRKCDLKFTGGTYLPETQSGKIIRKMVLQKNFAPLAASLEKAEEAKSTGLAREILEELEQEKEAPPKREAEAGAVEAKPAAKPKKVSEKPAKASRRKAKKAAEAAEAAEAETAEAAPSGEAEAEEAEQPEEEA